MVNMLRRCFPCSHPMSIIKPGGGGEIIWLKKSLKKSLTCFCTTKNAMSAQISPSEPPKSRQPRPKEHRGIPELGRGWALHPTHQLSQRRTGWAASPACPCSSAEVSWESGKIRDHWFFFGGCVGWGDDGEPRINDPHSPGCPYTIPAAALCFSHPQASIRQSLSCPCVTLTHMGVLWQKQNWTHFWIAPAHKLSSRI